MSPSIALRGTQQGQRGADGGIQEEEDWGCSVENGCTEQVSMFGIQKKKIGAFTISLSGLTIVLQVPIPFTITPAKWIIAAGLKVPQWSFFEQAKNILKIRRMRQMTPWKLIKDIVGK